MGNYWRPWGLLTWILNRLSIDQWNLIGSFSTEERGLKVLDILNSDRKLASYNLFFVKDPPSIFTSDTNAQLKKQKRDLKSLGLLDFTKIHEYELFDRHSKLVKGIQNILSSFDDNIIIDISALPKRFFFPIIRLAMEDRTKKNIIATYTRPNTYGQLLAQDPEPWSPIPLFGPTKYPEPKVRRIIIAIGFSPLGLPDFLEQGYDQGTVNLLLPFPPGPPNFNRNWEFIRRLEKNLPSDVAPDPIRIHPWDLPECFDRLVNISDMGNDYTLLAPYGPKTVSLAMCLFAELNGFPVYYTQPKEYYPFYSEGVAEEDGEPQVFAYCLRIDGQDLYLL
ncbi:hypothetical protein HNR65_002416 [Desulfosalsimonas propionicica]|uniref:Uncharacterized protein n=1 Tax=Desulfosalsimonas propionicica TaxID=332175 RepID=A0A7W0CAD4_9BACT|nr:hypothetical protein [Desulfosalsimonas propionicica]MBA2882082.1 hypothetical protein [Desulfosalsimonas propionicica]